jgi:hypothetical protein
MINKSVGDPYSSLHYDISETADPPNPLHCHYELFVLMVGIYVGLQVRIGCKYETWAHFSQLVSNGGLHRNPKGSFKEDSLL